MDALEVFEHWLASRMSGCTFARLYAHEPRARMYNYAYPSLTPGIAEDLDRQFADAADAELPAIAVLPSIRLPEQLVSFLAYFADAPRWSLSWKDDNVLPRTS